MEFINLCKLSDRSVMFVQVILITSGVVVMCQTQNDAASQQLPSFKAKTKSPIAIMTTSAGQPIEYLDATVSLNKPLIFNEYFMDSQTHLFRERISERVVHAKAGGAFGYFQVTHDISHICSAKLFGAVGKKTPIAVRFSPVVVERGGTDLMRDARGFSVKFYTEDGNFDIVGLNTPMFSIKDPLFFPTFVRAQKRNPVTNLFDGNMLWDFITLRPEAMSIFLWIFSDTGIPDGYRHMPGFGIHTFQVSNEHSDINFVRFHLNPDAGIKNLGSDEARTITGTDPDYAVRDLFNAIANGDFPTWSVGVQILSLEDAKNAGFDIFDVTKLLPEEKYPVKPLGKMVLDKNPINYFAEIEQLAFCPGNLVPGILGAPDKIFEARRFAYRDAQNYRLGVNFNEIQVNCPLLAATHAYNRDGRPPVRENERDIPNYFPNSFNGPIPYKDKKRVELVDIYQDPPNNFDQAREFYVTRSKEERDRLIDNILYSIGGIANHIQARAVKLLKFIHPDFGSRVEEGLLSNKTLLSVFSHPGNGK